MPENYLLDMHITSNTAWNIGYITSEDTQCFVTCVCGEHFSIIETPKECPKCGRIYWTEFRAYRMETDKQFYETCKMEVELHE